MQTCQHVAALDLGARAFQHGAALVHDQINILHMEALITEKKSALRMQEDVQSILSASTTRRGVHRGFAPPASRAFHARRVVEIRLEKSGRPFAPGHEWGYRASPRNDMARRKRSRLPREAVPDRCAALPEARHAGRMSADRIASHRRWAAPFSRASTAPVAAHHAPGVSPGFGIIAFTKHDHSHGRARANKRRRKARQRLGDQNGAISFRNRADDDVRIC